MDNFIQIPPLESFLSSTPEWAGEDETPNLVAEFMKSIAYDAQPGAFAGRPGRLDSQFVAPVAGRGLMDDLLKAQNARFKSPSAVSVEEDLAAQVEAIAKARLAEMNKAASPSTMSTTRNPPEKQAAPASRTPTIWSWNEDVSGEGITPKKNQERVETKEPSQPSHAFRYAAQATDLAKRAEDRAQEIVAKAAEWESSGQSADLTSMSDADLVKALESGPIHPAYAFEICKRQKSGDTDNE